jgi:hypothetical protein
MRPGNLHALQLNNSDFGKLYSDTSSHVTAVAEGICGHGYWAGAPGMSPHQMCCVSRLLPPLRPSQSLLLAHRVHSPFPAVKTDV